MTKRLLTVKIEHPNEDLLHRVALICNAYGIIVKRKISPDKYITILRAKNISPLLLDGIKAIITGLEQLQTSNLKHRV